MMNDFKFVEKWQEQDIYINDRYQVNVRKLKEGWEWLSIKRKDKEAIHDWRELQEIKNKLCGKEREAIELYPSESRLVDSSNQFHLWVLPEGEKFPFGYGDRLVVTGHDQHIEGKGGSKQRAFENEPEDAISVEEAKARVRK